MVARLGIMSLSCREVGRDRTSGRGVCSLTLHLRSPWNVDNSLNQPCYSSGWRRLKVVDDVYRMPVLYPAMAVH
jgi:hypothetical protein